MGCSCSEQHCAALRWNDAVRAVWWVQTEEGPAQPLSSCLRGRAGRELFGLRGDAGAAPMVWSLARAWSP